jgi:RNA polymerase sigma-70 factor (ECF subfamily)
MAFARTHNIESLISGCQKNDRKAQHELYKRYFGLMTSISMRYLGNREDAMEVVNTGFFKIFTKIEDFQGKGSFEGWMKRVIVNTALDFLKLQKDREMDIEGIDLYHSDVYVENTALEEIDNEAIMRFLQMVPKMSRSVFNLYVMEGMKHKEISETLGISEGTCHWHLQNARKILKEKIEEYLK